MTEVNFLCFSLSVLQLFLDSLVLLVHCKVIFVAPVARFRLHSVNVLVAAEKRLTEILYDLLMACNYLRILRYSYQIPLVIDVLK